MATSVTLNGNAYSIPSYNDTGYAQGSGNLSSYLVATATGFLSLAGGAFTLTADANFGAGFGLVALYLKSVAATVASAGFIRMANTDLIEWRNASSLGNNVLAVDGSDRLTYNGLIVATDAAALTAKAFVYSDASSIVASTAAPTNGQILIGSTGAIPVVASITGTGSQITVTPGAGTITLSTPQNIDTAATPTFASETLSAVSNQIVLGTTRTLTINAPTPAVSSRVLSIPDPGTAANFVLSEATATINGTKTFAGQLIGKGTATNDSAAAGYIGEYISAVPGTTSYPTSTNYGDLTSIVLTAGDWDVTGCSGSLQNGATVTSITLGISTTTGNSGTGLTFGDNQINSSGPTAATGVGMSVPAVRASLSAGSTTYYLKFNGTYTVAIPTANGRLSARRVR